jgi:uncharacterized membrane protein YuzA (DUF378 family)
MKTRLLIQEILLYLLTIWFFYQGLVKMAHWNEYIGWNTQIPYLRHYFRILGYGIPLAEMILSLLLQVPRLKKIALFVLIFGQVIYLILTIWAYNIGFLTFDPVPEQFGRVGWLAKIWMTIVSLVACLYCFVPQIWIEDGKKSDHF